MALPGQGGVCDDGRDGAAGPQGPRELPAAGGGGGGKPGAGAGGGAGGGTDGEAPSVRAQMALAGAAAAEHDAAAAAAHAAALARAEALGVTSATHERHEAAALRARRAAEAAPVSAKTLSEQSAEAHDHVRAAPKPARSARRSSGKRWATRTRWRCGCRSCRGSSGACRRRT